MRFLPLLVVLPLCAAPALAQPATSPAPPAAQTAATATAATASAATAPAIAAPAHKAKAKHARSHRGESWEKRFAAANTTHDGHLTLEQAQSGYKTIARHFKAIDVGHKGFVTLDDIRAWHKEKRQAHHRTAIACPDTRLQARPAVHRTMAVQPPVPNGQPPAAPTLAQVRSPS